MRLIACATQGTSSDDEARLKALVAAFDATFVEFSRQAKLAGALRLVNILRKRQFDLFVLEGSGFAGGFAAILGRLLWGMPYVLSSGDAVAPFLSARYPLGKPIFFLYEKLLCANASGFIGWTPYLVGRALTYGVLRAVTIPGWAPYAVDNVAMQSARRAIRLKFNIPENSVVFGLAGSLHWSNRYQYCYGAELVRAALRANSEAYVLIVGAGSGLDKLRQLAGAALHKSIFLPGSVPRHEVPAYLAAMDVGSIPQSVDHVGAFRYTTKISEYRANRLPYISNQIPMAYDLDDGPTWRVRGKSPWDPDCIDAIAELMKDLTLDKIAKKQPTNAPGIFERQQQTERVTSFLRDVIEAERAHSHVAST